MQITKGRMESEQKRSMPSILIHAEMLLEQFWELHFENQPEIDET